jgi:hypothetical protein
MACDLMFLFEKREIWIGVNTYRFCYSKSKLIDSDIPNMREISGKFSVIHFD